MIYHQVKQLEEKKDIYEQQIQKILNSNIKFENEPLLVVNEINKTLGEYSLINYINMINHYCLLIEALPKFYTYIKKFENVENYQLEKIIVYNNKLYQWSLNFLELAFNSLGLVKARSLVKIDLNKSYQLWQQYITSKEGISTKKVTTQVKVIWNIKDRY